MHRSPGGVRRRASATRKRQSSGEMMCLSRRPARGKACPLMDSGRAEIRVLLPLLCPCPAPVVLTLIRGLPQLGPIREGFHGRTGGVDALDACVLGTRERSLRCGGCVYRVHAVVCRPWPCLQCDDDGWGVADPPSANHVALILSLVLTRGHLRLPRPGNTKTWRRLALETKNAL